MLCRLPEGVRDWRNCARNVFKHQGAGCNGCWVAWLIFGLAILAQSHPDLKCFMPPWAKRASIFIRRECPAAIEKLVETGETVQGMFLSTKEQGEMVVGWLGCFWARTFGAIPLRSRAFCDLPFLDPKGPSFPNL